MPWMLFLNRDWSIWLDGSRPRKLVDKIVAYSHSSNKLVRDLTQSFYCWAWDCRIWIQDWSISFYRHLRDTESIYSVPICPPDYLYKGYQYRSISATRNCWERWQATHQVQVSRRLPWETVTEQSVQLVRQVLHPLYTHRQSGREYRNRTLQTSCWKP